MTYCVQRTLATIQARIAAILHDEKGQGVTEYALILFLVSTVAVLALEIIGTHVASLLGQAAGKV